MGTRKRKRKKGGCLLGFLLLLAFGGAGAFAYNSGILGTAVRELEGTVREVPFRKCRLRKRVWDRNIGQLEEEEKGSTRRSGRGLWITRRKFMCTQRMRPEPTSSFSMF